MIKQGTTATPDTCATHERLVSIIQRMVDMEDPVHHDPNLGFEDVLAQAFEDETVKITVDNSTVTALCWDPRVRAAFEEFVKFTVGAAQEMAREEEESRLHPAPEGR